MQYPRPIVTIQYLENISRFHISQGNSVVPRENGVYIELAHYPLYMNLTLGQPVPDTWTSIHGL